MPDAQRPRPPGSGLGVGSATARGSRASSEMAGITAR